MAMFNSYVICLFTRGYTESMADLAIWGHHVSSTLFGKASLRISFSGRMQNEIAKNMINVSPHIRKYGSLDTPPTSACMLNFCFKKIDGLEFRLKMPFKKIAQKSPDSSGHSRDLPCWPTGAVQSWSTSSKLLVVQDEGLEGFSSGGSFSTSAVPWTWNPETAGKMEQIKEQKPWAEEFPVWMYSLWNSNSKITKAESHTFEKTLNILNHYILYTVAHPV